MEPTRDIRPRAPWRLVLVPALALLCACGSAAAGTHAAPGAGTTPAAPAPAVAAVAPAAVAVAVPTVAAAPVVAVADVEAVARQVYHGQYPMGCSMNDRACPITRRLAARVFAVATPHPGVEQPGPADPFCRCQNPGSRSMSVAGEVTAAGGVAHVTLYPDAHPIRIDLVMLEQDGRLLVDDMRCTGGGPATSVYAATLVPCG